MKFSQKMPLNVFYTIVQKKSRMNKNSNQGGSALSYHGFDRSLQNASVGGEGLEKYNPGKSACKRD